METVVQLKIQEFVLVHLLDQGVTKYFAFGR